MTKELLIVFLFAFIYVLLNTFFLEKFLMNHPKVNTLIISFLLGASLTDFVRFLLKKGIF